MDKNDGDGMSLHCNDNDTKDHQSKQLDRNKIVQEYLHQIYLATNALIYVEEINTTREMNNDDTTPMEIETSNSVTENTLPSADVYIEKIANNLIQACHPMILSSEVSHLPTMNIMDDGDDDDDNKNYCDELDNMEENFPCISKLGNVLYSHRRSDYLRRLLRVLAPASMQICITILSIVLSRTRCSDDKMDAGTIRQQLLAVTILISHWLPVAPHLTTMVKEFFTNFSDTPWRNLGITKNSSQDDQIQLFVIAEALYQLSSFFAYRNEISTLLHFGWDWSILFDTIQNLEDVVMDGTDTNLHTSNGGKDNSIQSHLPKALQWYSARTLSFLMNWSSRDISNVLKQINVHDDRVPWIIHPWEIDQEELKMEQAILEQRFNFWGSPHPIILPSSEYIQQILRSSPYLAEIGPGISLYKQRTLQRQTTIQLGTPTNTISHTSETTEQSSLTGGLVPTTTTRKNLFLLGAAICQEPYPPPILVCGPHGSGKSSLIRELLQLIRPKETLMEFHIDEETDSKTLIGSYTTTDIPGEFTWRAGPLTQASRQGRWVVIEDFDCVPVEIQASLVRLFEERMVPLGNGNYESCHPDFRIFATCTTDKSTQERRSSLRLGNHRGVGKQILNPSYWRKVHVEPLPFAELKEIALSNYPNIPVSVVNSAISILQALDRSGRSASSDESFKAMDDNHLLINENRMTMMWTGGRLPSVRDFFKFMSRISKGVTFEENSTYTTEKQRMLCLLECVDVFVASSADRKVKEHFMEFIAAPSWGIPRQLALSYIEKRTPDIVFRTSYLEIGRAKINISKSSDHSSNNTETFSQTSHALRLMESLAVCVRQNEAVLLTGETGCGKTTIVQQLALRCGFKLIVQNLSLQTDSSDLLGGYRPLEIRNIARHVYMEFVDTFVATFSRKQNAKFLQYTASMLEKSNWKMLSQCFGKAAKLGLAKMIEDRRKGGTELVEETWRRFANIAEKFERQRLHCDSGMAFEFTEGALVDAIQSGKWVLLDEINLATSDTLERLCGLLDDPCGSLTLTERGDVRAIKRHPCFRLFAAMNPATDAGKKDLPSSIRGRFLEIYVEELVDPIELRKVAASYLDGVLPCEGMSPDHTETVITIVDLYLSCKSLAESRLTDGNGHKPKYTMRTLSRALTAAKSLIIQQRFKLERAVFEGFQLSFEGVLDKMSAKPFRKLLVKALLNDATLGTDLEQPGRRPGGKAKSECFVLVKPFWIQTGPLDLIDWSDIGADGKSKFILTKSVLANLRRLSRSLAAGPWPILLEGPTSSGKTTLVEYVAARCGHRIVRINNHEHTDIQEYTGSFSTDQNGSLVFQDGVLVQALRQGDWVILDELNLAPSEVLEALNRLLDDNRELYLAETNETVTPHPNFRLFATQNPSGAYGGRKPLSRAFRNRFVELYVDDIPSDEMMTILEKKCGCPPSHAKLLVNIMIDLRHRRSRSNVFLGKDSFISPRDLLRWAERHSESKQDLAMHGYMLLAERLRSEEEKDTVREVLEEHIKVTIDLKSIYYGEKCEARKILSRSLQEARREKNDFILSIAPTKSLLRLIYLVSNCIRQREPVLLVGETGCGKTTVVQYLSHVFGQDLSSINCHATTETSDLIGGLRPVRGKDLIKKTFALVLKELIQILFEGDTNKELEIHSIFPENCNAVVKNDFLNFGTKEVDKLVILAKTFLAESASKENSHDGQDKPSSKRRKLKDSSSPGNSELDISELERSRTLKVLVDEIEDLSGRYKAIFEWCDGPLVTAMKSGHMLLLDEISLAEDAVLERLNSVLEPSRTLVLAEKGNTAYSPKYDDQVVIAHNDFRIFATMNPGGDFGKRELSPALRSRFTEIWVPAISDIADFEIVLRQSFETSITQQIDLHQELVIRRLLEYLEWFNSFVCTEATNPFVGCALSLRDILSWAHFILESCDANHTISIWDAFYHGACLMHLDGLGLGSGLDGEAVLNLKNEAEQRLLQLIPKEKVSHHHGVDEPFCNWDGKFGALPFVITAGNLTVPGFSFDMTAPTTSLNIFRVLRAMQLKKPILLEGSPGVGKTSLISAVAAASGHKLVRINLSEQTDIADLIGSDLPVENTNSSGPSFEWRDGVLLKAIKEGSWVLLDELNLASQTVLEGLNSCLDHRATVTVPELGESFVCPPSFRVFGAQNPLGQGGGRKGLPKSFLNRFTKVFVDSLTDSDLRSIVSSRFQFLTPSVTEKIIQFNKDVQRDVVESRAYGSEGGPWEFNLRDVFRWCELLGTGAHDQTIPARDLYYHRFRTQEDRERVDLTFVRHFGRSMSSTEPPTFEVSDSSIKIGASVLHRVGKIRNVQLTRRRLPNISPLFSQLPPMETISRCITMRWPCLIVGGNYTGKTALVSKLADLCHTALIEHCLSPSSDVAELIGGYEQLDSSAGELLLFQDLCDLANEIIMADSLHARRGKDCWMIASRLRRAIDDSAYFTVDVTSINTRRQLAEKLIEELLSLVEGKSRLDAYIDKVFELQENLQLLLNESVGKEGGHFVWRDGLLVRAMTEGHWLLLENVNLCPASVLDRLNSVTEHDGFLLLSETGTQEDGEAHRIIKPHENFRIFLTMDPSNGEISRAMRNRCVEIYLLPTAVAKADTSSLDDKIEVMNALSKSNIVDHFAMLRGAGLRSSRLASWMVQNYADEHIRMTASLEEVPCFRSVIDSIGSLSGMFSRGVKPTVALQKFIQIGYEVKEEVSRPCVKLHLTDCFQPTVMEALPMNVIYNFGMSDTAGTSSNWEGRLMRPLQVQGLNSTLPSFGDITLASFLEVSPEEPDDYNILRTLAERPCFGDLFCTIAPLFMECRSTDKFESRIRSFFGLKCNAALAAIWMAEKLATVLQVPTGRDSVSSYNLFDSEICRLRQTFYEHRLVSTMSRRDPDSKNMHVLEASYFLYQNLIDETSVQCQVTRLLYPFFVATNNLISAIQRAKEFPLSFSWGEFSRFITERDRFWNLVKDLPLASSNANACYVYEEGEFLVQWQRLRKALARNEWFDTFLDISRQVKFLIESIDLVVVGSSRPHWSGYSIRKRLSMPLVPRKSLQWESFLCLNKLGQSCSLVQDERLDPFEQAPGSITVQDLLEKLHASLYVPQEKKFELLAVISTSQLSWSYIENLDKNWISSLEFSRRMSDSFSRLRNLFEEELASFRIYREMYPVDSSVEPEKIDCLLDTSAITKSNFEGYFRLKNRLLSAFGKMQVSPFAEYLCAKKEIAICAQLCRIALECVDEISMQKRVTELVPQMRKLVNSVLNETNWNICDMRTYQLLIWAAEGEPRIDMSFGQLLRYLMPTLLSTLSRHTFSNSYLCKDAFSMTLEMPEIWTDDESEAPLGPNHSTEKQNEVLLGSSAIRQQIRSDFMLHIFGQQLASICDAAPFKYYTIQNANYRESQAKHLFKMLSSSTIIPSKEQLFILHFILHDILVAARKTYNDNSSWDAIIELLRNNESMTCVCLEEISAVGGGIEDGFFSMYWASLLQPLLRSLHLAWNQVADSSEYIKQYSLASIYLGLLRLHILIPDTPLDPGTAPLAKISLISRELVEIQTKIAAIRLQNGFVRGNFAPQSSAVITLLNEVRILSTKKTEHEKKVIERIALAPSFIELFREIKEFAGTVLETTKILEIISSILNREGKSNFLEARVENWQRTAAAFAKRLTKNYGEYEDITAPILDSTRMIQDGLCSLMRQSHHQNVPGYQVSGKALCRLQQYPLSVDSESIKCLIEDLKLIASDQSSSELLSKLIDSFSVAILCRLLLKKCLVGLEDNEILACYQLFRRFWNSRDGLLADNDDNDTNLEAREERIFREQFPNHRIEFEPLLQGLTPEDISRNADGELNISGVTPGRSTSETEMELLYFLHNEIFSQKKLSHSDSIRKIAFHTSYAAAFELKKALRATLDIQQFEPMGGHAFATCLVSVPKSPMSKLYDYLWNTADVVDFENEACPALALTGVRPLEELMARITQLLSTFPGHSILVGLGKLCEKVIKLNLLTTPIGKVLTGMEVILRRAQDWEQHASQKVRIGSPLAEIGRRVADWRKLQLASWKNLIEARQRRHVLRARRHWMRLQCILARDNLLNDSDVRKENHGPAAVPSWVWKGFNRWQYDLNPALGQIRTEDTKELVKTLDTFMLTSPLGEFNERLNILKAISMELFASLKVAHGDSNLKLQQSRIFCSIWMYYGQYAMTLNMKLEKLRSPIETKLKNETRIAKWDEQSYYALAESTERNQKKLMKILAEFDESLDLNVGVLIQEETCYGLRTNVNAYDDFSSTFPTLSSLFPMRESEKNVCLTAVEKLANGHKECELFHVDKELIFPHLNDHLLKMSKYAQKMKYFEKVTLTRASSYGQIGGDAASLLSQAVFDRMESLRINGTRPMKERALIDLFRELKRHGYAAFKWATPPEIEEMDQLFLIPAPRLDCRGSSILERAEQYYVKCLSEIHSFQSETSMLGSKYMTKREMDMMVNLGHSSLFLLTQQRCIIAKLAYDNQRLKRCIDSIPFSREILPLEQSKLKSYVEEFQTKRELAYESIRQLSLLIRSSSTMIDNGTELEWTKFVVSQLESLSSNCSNMPDMNCVLITKEALLKLEAESQSLVHAEEVIKASRDKCESLACLPLDSFDKCLDDIASAIKFGMSWRHVLSKRSEDKNDHRSGQELYQDYFEKLALVIDRTLVAYQNLRKSLSHSLSGNNEMQDEGFLSIWDCHKESIKFVAALKLGRVNEHFEQAVNSLFAIYDLESVSEKKNEVCYRLMRNATMVMSYLEGLSEAMLQDALHFFYSSSKLSYTLVRVFRVLAAKGYCSDKSAEEEGGEGDIDGMNFEDEYDGTGMGDGDGKNDVTDQIENEDQLAGFKSNEKNDDRENENRDPRQLNEEEAHQGMEMAADFDGEMYDIPEQNEKETEDGNEDDVDELDRELGDDSNMNDQIVDEKMWNDSDDEDEINKEEETFERDSGVEGEAIEDAMRTKEGEDEKDPAAQKSETSHHEDPKNTETGESTIDQEDQKEDQHINDDTEERYEENQGVDVQGDDNNETQQDVEQHNPEQNDDQMQDIDNLDIENDSDDVDSKLEKTKEEIESLGGGSDEDVQDDFDAEHPVKDEEEAPENENTNSVEHVEGEMDLDCEENIDPEKESQTPGQNDTIEQKSELERMHGIRSEDGKDSIMAEDENQDEGKNEEDNNHNDAADKSTGLDSQGRQTEIGGNDGSGYSDQKYEETGNSNSMESSENFPNPLKDPGDASKYWHRRLSIIESQSCESSEDYNVNDTSQNQNKNSNFEYTSGEGNVTQVLGDANDDEAIELDPSMEEISEEDRDQRGNNKENNENECASSLDHRAPGQQLLEKKESAAANTGTSNDSSDVEEDVGSAVQEPKDDKTMETTQVEVEEEVFTGTQIVSDMSKLNVGLNESVLQRDSSGIDHEQFTEHIPTEASIARLKWLTIHGETQPLSRRLSEKLRLVMEPLVASKLRGDYRTGKRINMKRVIGYIASGYRKDKIWLRRTKPAKRDYRVLLAVDDSESMKKSGAGEMAIRAMATVAVGMNQLEIGELGVASFGEDMKLVHPFHMPFTSDSGVDVVRNFRFDQQRTRIALCVESAMAALEERGGHSSMQLVFLISDGRIERDSRQALKRLIREMVERNILLAMIIVEGTQKNKNSILNMKEVTFEKGKPVVKRFIEDYPFPYFIVLDDVASLPEVLGDALKQWFEMLSQLNNSTR